MSAGQKIPLKHYIYLILWGGSLFAACTPGFGWVWGLFFLLVFFLVTTFKVMKKLILIFILVAVLGGALISLLGEIAAVMLVVLPIVSIILKINFLRKNWKALRLGFYAYFGYTIIMAICGTTLPIVGMFVGAFIFTVIFHKLLVSLYREGYSVDKAFSIIGLTPIIILSFLLPFLKVDVFGINIFDGIAPDDVSVDIHRDINFTSKAIDNFVGDEDVKTAMQSAMKLARLGDVDMGVDFKMSDVVKLSGVDFIEIINVPVLSHTIEAAFAFSAAYGVFKVSSYEKECTIRNGDSNVEIISPIDEVHSVITDKDGNKIGDIYLDREEGLETVKLSNGFIYSIFQATGYVIDADGNFLGKITDDVDGTKILLDKDGNVIKKFKFDGLVVDGDNIEIGVATA